MSTLMFWNKQNGNANQNGSENGTSGGKNGKKTWLHSPESLINGHVAYLVKFLGCTPVDQAKGIDTVKDAIRRLQFSSQMKKAESGSNVKTKKVEITISVDGVAIQEPRGVKILHQFPLHNISYCADEKGVKKFFSFIAKNNQTNVPNDSSEHAEETHECFVFISSKLASDITLTIGQAFELAYRRFVNESGKGTEMVKLQSHNKHLEQQVEAYRQRLRDVAEAVPKAELDRILMRYGLRDILEVPPLENGVGTHVANINGSNTPDLGIDVSSPNNDDQLLIETSDKHFAPIVPPRNIQNQISSTLDALKPSVGTKLEGLLLNSDSDSDFDPRADENDVFSSEKSSSESFFGFEPPKTSIGQQLFAANSSVNGNGLTNGSPTANKTNGVANKSPPLLAPPPKASVPRRNGNISANQDLFGSTPFDAPLHSSPFDVQSDAIVATSSVPPTANRYDAFNVLKSNDGSDMAELYFQQTGSGFQIANPFNDSPSLSFNIQQNNAGINANNQLIPTNDNLFPQIKSITSNGDKLDGLITNFANYESDINSQIDANSAKSKTTAGNPFEVGLDKSIAWSNESHELDLTASMLMKSMENSSIGVNYDALRHSIIESETNKLLHADTEQNGKKSQSAKKEIPVDLFKDAASAAFSEFESSRIKNHEFYNKISGMNFLGNGFDSGKIALK